MEITINDVFILEHFDNRPITSSAKDWEKEQFGANVVDRLEELMNYGYLRTNTIQEAIELLTIPELKAILKAKQLKLSGNKAELINRILDNFSNAELTHYWQPYYRLTDSGIDVLNSNSLYLINRKNGYGFRIEELREEEDRLKHEGSLFEPNDIFFNLLSKKLIQYSVEKNWWDLYFGCIQMQSLLTEKANYTDSLKMLFYCWTITLSGCSNENYVENPESIRIPPDLINRTEKIKMLSNINETDFGIMALDSISKMQQSLNFSYYTPLTVYNIMDSLLKGNVFNISIYPVENERPITLTWEYMNGIQQENNPVESTYLNNKTTSFYEKNWFMWIMLIIFPPMGLFLLWRFSNYSKKNKWIITFLFILVMLVAK